jgi:hypothetical protein
LNIVAPESILQIKMYNVEGHLVKTRDEPLQTSAVTLRVDNLAAGMYMVHVKTATKTFGKKVLIRK